MGLRGCESSRRGRWQAAACVGVSSGTGRGRLRGDLGVRSTETRGGLFSGAQSEQSRGRRKLRAENKGGGEALRTPRGSPLPSGLRPAWGQGLWPPCRHTALAAPGGGGPAAALMPLLQASPSEATASSAFRTLRSKEGGRKSLKFPAFSAAQGLRFQTSQRVRSSEAVILRPRDWGPG